MKWFLLPSNNVLKAWFTMYS